MADLDLIDLLTADHRNLLSGPAPDIKAVSQHLGVERDLLYPAIRHHVRGGEAVLGDLRRSERSLEAILEEAERPDHGTAAGAEVMAALREAIRGHAAEQEALFPRLREEIPEEDLVRPVATIPLSIGGAPTHAHLRLATAGPAGEVAEDAASVTDHLHDMLRRTRTEPGRQDG